jgi:hypothetical protein
MVTAALLDSHQIRALVDAHSYGTRVVRLIPVSAVGPDFAAMDDTGHVVKRRDGQVRPTNVEVPFAAVLPDLFDQVTIQLDPALQPAVDRAARSRIAQRALDAERALASFRTHPAGIALRRSLDDVLGPGGQDLAGMFLDWRGLVLDGAVSSPHEAPTLDGARARAVADFCMSLWRIEAELPSSRLSQAR